MTVASARCTRLSNSDPLALEAAIHRWTTAVNARDVNALNATMTEDVELLETIRRR